VTLYDARELDAPIAAVTLLEDRARVVRRARASLDGEAVRFLVADVAPVIADKTLFARIKGAAGASVADARVVRRRVLEPATELPEDGDAGELREKLARELRAAERRERGQVAALEMLEARADGIARLAGWTLAEIAEDVAIGRGVAEVASEQLGDLSRRERRLRDEQVAAEHELARLRAEMLRLRRRIDELTSPSSRIWAGVILDLVVDRPGDAEIEIEYVTPGALWRPAHTAELVAGDGDGGPTVRMSTSACVWQNTGEDWSDVELLLSTERASLGAEPPHLFTDELAVRRRDDAVVVETREQEVQALAARGEQVSVATELPGIDDGGAAIALAAPGLATIPGDGRPYRVPLWSFDAAARVELWAYPELSGAVITRSVHANRGSEALLAGPVELIRERGWVGRTSIGFVAPGEEFELSWGPDPDLRVRRTFDESRSESRMLSAWSTRERCVEIRLSNLGRDARAIKVRERVPVSEIEKVKIELRPADATGGVKPDEDGFLTWPIDLGPGEHTRVSLRYTIKKHDDVVGI
jgi:uncharacterized protein (TIGR02231 family)